MFKKIFILFFLSLYFTSAYCQAPEKLSYQAVIRDNTNKLVTNQNVGVRVSIIKDQNPDPVYIETHSVITNANGLISYRIGEGTVVSGVFENINWFDGAFSVQTETDTTGGTNYNITGNSTLTSVPYALHAKTANSLSTAAKSSLSIAKCNCDSYIIPDILYNSVSTQSIVVSNTPASWFGANAPIVGASVITAEAIDEDGNLYDLGTIGTVEVGKVMRIQTEIDIMLGSSGFISGRVAVRIKLSNPEYAFITATNTTRSVIRPLNVQCVRF